MSWTQLKDNFEDLASFFKGTANNLPYPDLKNKIINDIKTENWNKSLSYSFKVVDKNNGKDFKPAGANKSFSPLNLQINPIEINQDEDFAINITPTQDAIVSEHNAIVFRDLTITCISGIHPLRGVGGVNKDGKIIGAGADKISGYEEFQRIRNYFRAYATMKAAGNANRNAVLVYVNRKDNENLIIEPLKFSSKKTGATGKLYNYTIETKGIGNLEPDKDNTTPGFFEKLDDVIEDVNDTLATGRGIVLRSEELLRQLEREINTTLFEPLRQVSLFVKTVGGAGTSVGDMSDNLITRFNSNTTLQFLGLAAENQKTAQTEGTDSAIANSTLPQNPQKIATEQGGIALLSLGSASLTGIEGDEEDLPEDLAASFAIEKNNARQLTRDFFETLVLETERIRDNAAEAFGLGDETYNSYAGRQQTFTPSPTKQTTNEEQEILFGFSSILSSLNLILAYGNSEFQKNIEEDFNEAEDNFNNLINIPVPNSVNEIVVAANQSLEDIAFVELNDINRWIEIAKLNNLKPPYIAEVSTDPRIKQPNDRLLLPSDGIQIDTNVIITKENKINKDLTETEKRLGIDFRLNDNFDFIFNNSGDVLLIRGGANAGQAIRIKFNLERGDLKYHPNIGLGLLIGEKNVNIDTLFDDITGTILQDPRFESIPAFDLRLKEGNTLVLNMNLLITESDTPIPVDINL